MKKPLNFLVLIFMLCILAFTLTACSGDNNDGGETPPSHTHEYSTEYTYDNDYHWYECECGEKSNVENHSGGTATCTTLAECSVCGEGYGEFENHDYAELKYNATEHWYECECGEKSNVEKHSGGTPTCTVLAECSVCGEGYGEYSDHTYKKGKCDCGAIDPTYMTEGLKFNLINNYTEYEVSGYTGTSTEVIIPTFYQNKPVTSIEERAFMGCDSLKSIVLPSSVTSIGELPFAVCTSLESIDVAEDNPNYKDIDGNLYTKDGKVLLQYAIGKTASQFIISNSVTSIGIGAFAFCTSLTSITIGNSVTSIGEHAFDSCTSLTSIEIPNSVTNIGVGAFAYCESLNYNIKNELKYLGNSNNPYLYLVGVDEYITTATLDNNCRFIGNSAFWGCASLTSVTIGNSVTSIGNSAFYDCDSLTSIVIPNSVIRIGGGAFYDCDSLQSIIVDSNNANYKDIDGNLYNKDGSTLIQYAKGKDATSFTIPSSVTSIGSSAFSGCSSLQSIEIPLSVTSIGYEAFSYCRALTSIVIPNSVTSIGESVFFDCYSSTTIYCEAESQPSGWNSSWKSGCSAIVVWGYKGEN